MKKKKKQVCGLRLQDAWLCLWMVKCELQFKSALSGLEKHCIYEVNLPTCVTWGAPSWVLNYVNIKI